MKSAKSSYSLHSKPSQPFQEQNFNTLYYNKHNSIFKKFNANLKQSSVVYNARGRLNTCINQLQELQSQIETMNVNNKELSLQVTFLREEYNVRKMTEIQTELTNAVKQLKKKVTIGNRSDLLKFESLNQILGSLYKNHKQLKGKVQQIQARVHQLQQVMGNYAPSFDLPSE